MVSVTSIVTGGGDSTTFVLVAPPPQAASTIAASTRVDNSMVVLLILHLLLSNIERLIAISKKHVTLKKLRVTVWTFRSDQGDALEMSFSLLGFPPAKHIQSCLTINGGYPKIRLGDSFTVKSLAWLQKLIFSRRKLMKSSGSPSMQKGHFPHCWAWRSEVN
jgi:hypothetical protein